MNNTDKDIFRTPEGYFDNLNERIMSNIPSVPAHVEPHSEKARMVYFQRTIHLPFSYRWVAACACVLVISITAYLHFDSSRQENIPTIMSEQNDAFTEAADYVMMNNNDVYNLLAED